MALAALKLSKQHIILPFKYFFKLKCLINSFYVSHYFWARGRDFPIFVLFFSSLWSWQITTRTRLAVPANVFSIYAYTVDTLAPRAVHKSTFNGAMVARLMAHWSTPLSFTGVWISIAGRNWSLKIKLKNSDYMKTIYFRCYIDLCPKKYNLEPLSSYTLFISNDMLVGIYSYEALALLNKCIIVHWN